VRDGRATGICRDFGPRFGSEHTNFPGYMAI
jgi:hypothetical protein